VAEHDRPDRERDVEQAEGGAQRDAGDDAGQRDRQDDQQRDRLAAEEFGLADGGRAERAEQQGDRRGDAGDLYGEAECGPDIRPVPGDGEPLQSSALAAATDSSSPRS
jgi:hypothetical protein